MFGDSVSSELRRPSRRAFLLAAATTPQIFGNAAFASQGLTSDFWNQPRWVWLRRHRTNEEIRTVYWANGQLIESEYERVCWFLRDRHINKAMYMSPVLLDVLYAQCGWARYVGIDRPMISTSGARFQQTNNRTEGAAKDSKHTTGEAHDGFFEGVQISVQSQFAQWIGGGGVGFYPNKHFIHTDVGKVRYWRG